MSDLIADLIECARLLGATQAKKGIGCYTREDARFERAMHESISDKAKRLTAERDELRRQLAEAEQDARRYQWLRRAREHWDILHRYDEDSRWIDLHGNDLDATIDSAMGGGNE